MDFCNIKKNIIVLIFFSNLVCLQNLLGQSDANTSDSNEQTVLDASPFMSARASGMGQALSSLANGSEAYYYNPAGIGGLNTSKGKKGLLRTFHFPYIGAAANENTKKLRSEFANQGGASDSSIGETIVEANEGKRQYARFSTLLDLTLGRSAYAAYSDVQLAAIKSSGSSNSEGTISLQYKSTSGVGFGFSVVDSKDRFYLGAFSSYNSISLTDAEKVSYLDIVSVDRRKTVISDYSTKWSGTSSNIGIIWVFSKTLRPSLSIVARDIGNSVYTRGSDKSDLNQDTLQINQDLTSAFSLSPSITKDFYLNFIVEGHHLTDATTALKKKMRSGLELTYGGFGSNSTLGLRGGYNSAGASYGASINIGLLQLEYASETVDIGLENKEVTERRSLAIFSVNMAND
ncbi:MAG: hypothetical protein R3B45_08010 [Bdellovibrionota bacterium]